MKSGLIIIRQAVITDITDIIKIENTCFVNDAFSNRQISYLVSKAKGIFYIAEYNGITAGYISLITNKRTNSGRVYSVAVHPDYRGLGIAESLVDRAIDFTRQEQLKSVFLEVRTDNTAAISLYEKKGFVKRFVIPYYYEDGSDGYSYVLPLKF